MQHYSYHSNYPASNKQNKVEISLYASKLKNVAGAFKGTSDPFAVVTLLAGTNSEQPHVLGKTETYVIPYSFFVNSPHSPL